MHKDEIDRHTYKYQQQLSTDQMGIYTLAVEIHSWQHLAQHTHTTTTLSVLVKILLDRQTNTETN